MGFNYIQDHSVIFMPYLMLNFLGIVLGTLGNLCVILTICCDKKLRLNPTYMVMLNLAVSDIGISTLVHSFTNVGIILGEKFFHKRYELCIFLGSFCLISCGTSLINMGILAFNRYTHICHHSSYRKIFTFKKTLLYCIAAWLSGFLIDLPNLLGWGGHFFDQKSANCMWNRLANRIYSIFFPLTTIFIPCILIMCYYIRIFTYTLKSKKAAAKKVKKSIVSASFKSKSFKSKKKSLKIAISLFASFALFTVCWVPYGLVIVFGFEDKFPTSIHVLVTFMAHINSTMNPILYICLNPAFYKSFKKLKDRITSKKYTTTDFYPNDNYNIEAF